MSFFSGKRKFTTSTLFLLLCHCTSAQADPNQFVAVSVDNAAISDDGAHVVFLVTNDHYRNPQIPYNNGGYYKYFDVATGTFIKPDTTYKSWIQDDYLRYSVNNGPDGVHHMDEKASLVSKAFNDLANGKKFDFKSDVTLLGTLPDGNSLYGMYWYKRDDKAAKHHDYFKYNATYYLLACDQTNNIKKIATYKIDLKSTDVYKGGTIYGDRFTHRNQYLMPGGDRVYLFGSMYGVESGKKLNDINSEVEFCEYYKGKFSPGGDTLLIPITQNRKPQLLMIDTKTGQSYGTLYPDIPQYDKISNYGDVNDNDMVFLDFTPDLHYYLFCTRNKAVVSNNTTGKLTWLSDPFLKANSVLDAVLASRNYVAKNKEEEEYLKKRLAEIHAENERRRAYWDEVAERSRKIQAAQEAEFQKKAYASMQPAASTTALPNLPKKNDNTEQQRRDQMNKEAAQREKSYNDKWGYYSH